MSYPYLIHHYLAAAADRTPDALAVVDRDRSTSYADLEERSNRLAHLLRGLGVGKGDRVGLYLDKSLEAVVGVYGTLKAGAAYVPIDPGSPTPRASYIVENCNIRVLLSGVEKSANWPHLAAADSPLEHVVVMNAQSVADAGSAPPGVTLHGSDAIDAATPATLQVDVIEQDTAYLLYTSGSTGAPKGVALSHLNCLGFVRWTVDMFDVRSEDRLSSVAPLHFDLSTFDLFGAAVAGASVTLMPSSAGVFPREVTRFIEDSAITVCYSVPSILIAITEYAGLGIGDLPGLRQILFAGEVFPTKYLTRLMQQLPHVGFANLFGPTETNVCTYYEVATPPRPEDGDIPIGKAIGNVETFVIDDSGQRAAPGTVGELFVRGPTVMQGYWGDPEKTASRLVPDPRDNQFPDPVYRTGDLVEELPDGNYRFLGRRDNQIKSRGYRIELGEIETALHNHPAVLECAVVAIPDDLVTNRLEAYVSTRGSTDAEELRRHCGDLVPKYMIPERINVRDSLPKTSTGKIDRQHLLSESLDA